MLNRAKSAAPSVPMSEPRPNRLGPAPDFAALEETLCSSEIGRNFLADYARQHPSAETQLLLKALARLEAAVIEPRRRSPSVSLLAELVDLSRAVSDMRQQVDDLVPCGSEPLPEADAFDQIVSASTRATFDVLTVLEEIQNVAWAMREADVSDTFCDKLDASAVSIFAACARQEVVGKETARVVSLLQDIEQRLGAMVETWGCQGGAELLEAARSLDVSEAFDASVPRYDAPQPGGEPDGAIVSELLPASDEIAALEEVAKLQSAAEAKAALEPEKPKWADAPAPLTLKCLDTTQRATLFG